MIDLFLKHGDRDYIPLYNVAVHPIDDVILAKTFLICGYLGFPNCESSRFDL